MNWRIVGMMLVQNEDLFVEQAFANAIEFCDEMILVDNNSSDETWPKLGRLAANCGALRVRLERLDDPGKSHEFLQPFAGSKTWVFAVDGDELYDRARLREMRTRLLAGEFADSWTLFGNVLNAVELDLPNRTARGHLAPPCRSMTKIYNFHAIDAWDGPCPERLLGGTIRFRPGFDLKMRRDLHHEMSWEESFFRCVHLCFLRRSSSEPEGAGGGRANVMEKHGWRLTRAIKALGRRFIGRKAVSYKNEKYRRGESVAHDVSAFFDQR